MIFLNFLIVAPNPSKIDSPTRKWPILNSLMPGIFDKIFAELNVRPWPA